jgi:hypothetical protein
MKLRSWRILHPLFGVYQFLHFFPTISKKPNFSCITFMKAGSWLPCYFNSFKETLMNSLKKLIAAIMVMVTLAGLTPLAAQETANAQPDFVLVNGTGEEIKEILIIPSPKKYKHNKNACAIQGISLADTGVLAVTLPDTMQKMDSFDLKITYGKKDAKTKKSVTIAKGEAYVLSIKDKPSSVPSIAAIGVGAGGLALTTAAGGTAGFMAIVTAAGLLGPSAAIGVGTVITTLAAPVVAPVAVAVLVVGGITALVRGLSTDTLQVTKLVQIRY